MRTELGIYEKFQVFLNFPFDEAFEPYANAMHFAVVAAGLIPVCAKDLTTPDKPRLEILVDAIVKCHYSIHDFSRLAGEGEKNFARFNMPVEMGMALFNALQTQRKNHRCAFFVPSGHDYKMAASDLAGLDPIDYKGDELSLVAAVYEWLRDTINNPIVTSLPTKDVKDKYIYLKRQMERLDGNGVEGRPNHAEAQELIYSVCVESGWWDWRGTKAGQIEFRSVPLSWKS